MLQRAKPILVAACGRAFCGDDAFGPMALQRLRRRQPQNIDFVELGDDPTALLDQLPGRSTLIVIDAAVAPESPPGQILICDWDAPDRPPLLHESAISSHGIPVGDQVELARRLGLLPAQVLLAAVTIASADAGHKPCPQVLEALDRVELELLARFNTMQSR